MCTSMIRHKYKKVHFTLYVSFFIIHLLNQIDIATTMTIRQIKLPFLLIALALSLQSFVPMTKSYIKDDYKAANQNWSLEQDSKGIIYAGNHYGLLEFNGFTWQHHLINGEQCPARSLYIDDNDRIYVGSFKDLGYFQRNNLGELYYTSICPDTEYYQNRSDDIWSIVENDGKIYFQSFSSCYIYNPADNSLDFVKSDYQLSQFSLIDGKIIFPHNQSVIEFRDNNFLQCKDFAPIESKSQLKTILPYLDGSIMAITEANEIFVSQDGKFSAWQHQESPDFECSFINRAFLTRNLTIIFGTITDGVFAFSCDGKLLWHLNTLNGLSNNTVLDIKEDIEGNIWIATDYGLTMIYGTPIRIAVPNRNIGSVYDVAFNEKDNFFYVATNQGLYKLDNYSNNSGKNRARFVNGTEGFIQDIYTAFDGTLFLGHNNRTITIDPEGGMATTSNRGGAMCFKPINIDGHDFVVGSSYTFFTVYTKPAQGKWHIKSVIKNFRDAIQYFEFDSYNRIWGGHSKTGLYCITVNKHLNEALDVKFYPSPDKVNPHKTGVFKIKDEIVFTDGEQIYALNPLNDEIVPYTSINEAIGVFASANRITKVDDDNYWFITKERAALVNFSKTTPEIIKRVSYNRLRFSMLDNYENIVPFSKDNSIICIHNGLADINHSVREDIHDRNLFIESITAQTNAKRNKTLQLDPNSGNTLSLKYIYNSLDIRMAYPTFQSQHDMYYRLSKIDSNWRRVNQGHLLLSRLPAGKYTLQIGIKDNFGKAVSLHSVDFRIRPPFYLAWYMILTYILLAFAIVRLLMYKTKKKNLEATRKLHEKQQQEIIKLENEKLQSEIEFKSKELANSSMNLIRRSEMLQTLKDELLEQKKQLGTQYPNKYFNKMLSLIEGNMSSEQEWEIFQNNFDLIHKNFFRNLVSRYPELSANDLKLCALLRLNMDTKEIAQMTNVTVRGIETRRYRLRKKLDLGPDESLNKFLLNLK